MKLKKCKTDNIYTLREICEKCGQKTSDAHYKFIKFFNKDLPSETKPKSFAESLI